MKNKCIITLLLIILPFMVFMPRVHADFFEKYDKSECQAKYKAEGVDCPIFGDPRDDGKSFDPDCDELPSTANFLQSVFTFIRYFGPALAIILSIVEFVKAAAAQDADALAKAGKKTGWRIALAIALFFVPVIINTVFSWFGWYGTCGIS